MNLWIPWRLILLTTAFAINAVHGPNEAPDDLTGKYRAIVEEKADDLSPAKKNDLAVKYAMLDSMDRAVGKILEALEARGVIDDTLIDFFNDPAETKDIAASHPEIVESLHERLRDLVTERRPPEQHTNISRTISEPLLVFGEEENAAPPSSLPPYLEALPPSTKKSRPKR